ERGALRCRRPIVLNLWHAYIRAAQVGWDANVVVAMRLMRLAVGGALAQREAQRMVAEKVAAIVEAQAAAITKMIVGGGMAAATKSASAVYQRKVRANRRRYSTLISLVPARPAPDCARRCRVLGAKRKSCAQPEHYRF